MHHNIKYTNQQGWYLKVLESCWTLHNMYSPRCIIASAQYA